MLTPTLVRFLLSLLSLSLSLRLLPPVSARALRSPTQVLAARQAAADQPTPTPTFPTSIPACTLCAPAYPGIDSCAQAAPVLANFSQVLFNPGAFIAVIECACTDTFQSAYPQCVDCFTQTNQTSFLLPSSGTGTSTSLPAIVTGIRNVCALESTLIGNASEVDSASAASATGAAASATASSSAALEKRLGEGLISTWTPLLLSALLGLVLGVGALVV